MDQTVHNYMIIGCPSKGTIITISKGAVECCAEDVCCQTHDTLEELNGALVALGHPEVTAEYFALPPGLSTGIPTSNP